MEQSNQMRNPAADALGITEINEKLDKALSLIGKLMQERRPAFYTPAQAAEELGVSTRTITRKIARGELQRTPQGIPREALDAINPAS
jgi:excisionase family DNA binding protein